MPWLHRLCCKHASAQARVRNDLTKAEAFSKLFDIDVGVHQGAPLSPLLFVILMQWVFVKAKLNDATTPQVHIKRSVDHPFAFVGNGVVFMDDLTVFGADECGDQSVTRSVEEKEEARVKSCSASLKRVRFVDEKGVESHKSACRRTHDPKIVLDPANHKILRAFGVPWSRFFIIYEKSISTECSWHHSAFNEDHTWTKWWVSFGRVLPQATQVIPLTLQRGSILLRLTHSGAGGVLCQSPISHFAIPRVGRKLRQETDDLHLVLLCGT